MAMRRPRIKPVANIQLNCKRKTKSSNDGNTAKVEGDANNSPQEIERAENTLTPQAEETSQHAEKVAEVLVEHLICAKETENKPRNDSAEKNTQELDNKTENDKSEHFRNITLEKDDALHNAKEELLKNSFEEAAEVLNDSDAFKYPPNIGYQRSISHTSNSGIDDVFYSDIEENALQMDLEKSSTNSSLSPSKNFTRQRIRATPHFSQRRNSFVGSSPTPHTSANEENHVINSNANDITSNTPTKRERHNSASITGSNLSSSHHFHHPQHKYLPTGVPNTNMGRIRTESGCSVFSDTNNSSHKSRKNEENKQNSRKDYEARFQNGVPEKAAIKMSDLIYYNPITNPMEQKSNSNVKLEQTNETSSNDVKPFTDKIEKIEKECDSTVDNDAALVPQLKLNAKGELILDDKSLLIETTAEQEARKVLANSSLIYLDENTGMNGFYSRQKRTREWIPSETIKFYRCLQNIGTDFSLMVALFPTRTRRDLKLKFKKEERKNCQLINKALLYPKQFDIESLKEQLSEEEKLREEQAKRNKKESYKRKIANVSKAKRILINEDVYQNENVQKPRRVRKTKKTRDESNHNIQKEKECQIENEQESEKLCKVKDKSTDVLQNEIEIRNIQNEVIVTEKEEGMCMEKEHKGRKRKAKNTKLTEDPEKVVNSDTNIEIHEDGDVVKRRRKRKRASNKVKKEEIIKVENSKESNATSTNAEFHDSRQLQTEINELLDSDLEMQHNTEYEKSTSKICPVTSQLDYNNEQVNKAWDANKINEPCIEVDKNKNNYIYIDSNENTLTMKNDNNYLVSSTIEPLCRSQLQSFTSEPPRTEEQTEATIPESDTTIDNCSSVISERELNEDDIQSILTELAEGSLVLVSTLDPDNPDKVLNEIYMVDKNTGDLCEEPLNIPDNIVQCIITVVS